MKIPANLPYHLLCMALLWVLIGADQFLHQLTYLAMIAAALAMRA